MRRLVLRMAVLLVREVPVGINWLLSYCCVSGQGVILVVRRGCFGVMKRVVIRYCFSGDMPFGVIISWEWIVYMNISVVKRVEQSDTLIPTVTDTRLCSRLLLLGLHRECTNIDVI